MPKVRPPDPLVCQRPQAWSAVIIPQKERLVHDVYGITVLLQVCYPLRRLTPSGLDLLCLGQIDVESCGHLSRPVEFVHQVTDIPYTVPYPGDLFHVLLRLK